MNQIPLIPGYRIEHKLGEGGMATVYLATQEKLTRKVAIKILDPSFVKAPNIAKRFIKEARTAASLNHSNIVSVFDVGKVEHFYYMIMEYLDGSLRDILDSSPDNSLKPEEILDYIKRIAPALDYAHQRGIIHRDIKPDNIMFRQDGTPVLVDFGIARAADSAASNMTKTGMSIGTPHYMSPEQCKAEDVDGRSDFYSLGVVLYEALTGDKPYKAETTVGVALKHIQDAVPRLAEELEYLQPLLNKMMAKDKEERVGRSAQLIQLIDKALSPDNDLIVAVEEDDIVQVIVDEIGDEIEQFQPTVETPVPTTPPPSTPAAAPRPLKKEFFTIPDRLFNIPNRIVIPLMAVLLAAIFIYFFIQGFQSEAPPPEPKSQENIEKTSPPPTTQTKTIDQTETEQAETPGGEDTPAGEDNQAQADVSQQTSPKKRPTASKRPKIQPVKTEPVQPETAAPPALSENETFQQAKRQNTIEAYRKYMQDYPSGSHMDEVMMRIDQLKEAATVRDIDQRRTRKVLSFRAAYKTLGYEEVEKMIKRRGFFDNSFNSSGKYSSRLQRKVVGGQTVVVDYKAGLMWFTGGSPEAVKYKKVRGYLKNLNRRQVGGFSDWRLPTVEEAASLLRPLKSKNGLYTDAMFSGTQKRTWTGDRFGADKQWVVRFYSGIVFSYPQNSVQYIRPVRTMK